MPDQMTVQQFGATIKQKYPAYASRSDDEVGKAMLAKYPQYASRVKIPSTDSRNAFQRGVDELQNYIEHPEQRGEGQPNVANRFGGGIVQGGLRPFAHPIETVKSMAGYFAPPHSVAGIFAGPALPLVRQVRDVAKGMIADPARTTGQLIGGVALGELTGDIFGGVKDLATSALPETAGKFARSAAGAGPKTVKELVKQTKAINEKGASDTAIENQTAEAKALNTRKSELSKHATEKAKAVSKNKGVQEGLTSDLEAQRKIAPTVQKLSNARSALRAAVETAREKALKIGNKLYSGVNEKLNAIPSDMAGLSSGYAEASNSFGEALNQPPLLKRLGQLLEEPPEGETKSPVTYKDEQQLYSELGKELSKGSLNGPTYHAYDVLHESIGKDMQRIADLQGQGEALSAARNYWRRMKQTFGKPISFTDAATKAIGGVTDETQANQVRLLGSFDPEIPKLVKHVSNIEKGVSSLPKETPERVLTEKAAAEKLPVPGKGISPKIELTPRPTPKTFDPPKIGAKEVAEVHKKGYEARQKLVEHKAGWMAAGSLIYTAIDMLKGEIPSTSGVGTSIGGSLAVQAMVTKILSNPKVMSFLEEATPADVAQIPPELRGEFPKLIAAAEKRGVKVSPVLTKAFVGAAAVGNQNGNK